MQTLTRVLAAALLLSATLTTSTQADDQLAKTWRGIENSVVVIGYQKPDHTFQSYGSGFCIYSDATTSYFLTNKHVVAPPNTAQPTTLVVMLPPVGPSGTSYPATIVASVPLPTDLAIVSIDVPNLHALKISNTLPDEGQDVAWGGYPWVIGANAGHIIATAAATVTLPPGVTPNANPLLEHDSVSGYLPADVYLMFGMRGQVDEGNSGGPVFDPQTGAVYGVIEGRIPGSPTDADTTDDAATSNLYGLAISMRSAYAFLQGQSQSVSVAFAQSDGEGDAVRVRSSMRGGSGNSCIAALDSFGIAYAVWFEAHGMILGNARNENTGADSHALVARYTVIEQEWAGALQTRATAIAQSGVGSAKRLSKGALAVVAAAQRLDRKDATLSESLGSLDAFNASRAAESDVYAASRAMDPRMCFS